MSATTLQILSPLIAATAIIVSIGAWRRSELGKRRVDLAEELLELSVKAQDAIRDARSPLGFVGEGNTRKRGEGEDPKESEILDRAYVAAERFQRHVDVFNKVYSLRTRARAYFGEEVSKALDELLVARKEVLFAGRKLARYWHTVDRQSWTEEQRQQHLEKMFALEEIFWAGGEPDPIAAKVSMSVEAIDRVCVRAIRPTRTLWCDVQSVAGGVWRYLTGRAA